MPQILAISSWVARGHVGLSAVVPALHEVGRHTIALPTIILSNHLGHAHAAGEAVPEDQLRRMAAALTKNGWLSDVSAVLTGFFPSASHVGFAADLISQILESNPNAIICVDPVMGDEPDGLYVDPQVAEAIRSKLLPVCHCLTPNAFELHWLTGHLVKSPGEAVKAVRSLNLPCVLATSIRSEDGKSLSNLVVTPDAAWQTASPQREGVPHGTGDVLAALFLAHRLDGLQVEQGLANATGKIDALVRESAGKDELQLVAQPRRWLQANPAPVSRIR